ncbi:MAG: hypothetical protein M3Y59_21270 [Myxococcota bacterium]|nr:hypothetical protein [Myxococcota bacterium]
MLVPSPPSCAGSAEIEKSGVWAEDADCSETRVRTEPPVEVYAQGMVGTCAGTRSGAVG